MIVRWCATCRLPSGFRRAFGLGTVVLLVATAGWWALAMPFYPKRCGRCGMTAGASFRAARPWARLLAVGAGLLLLCWLAGGAR